MVSKFIQMDLSKSILYQMITTMKMLQKLSQVTILKHVVLQIHFNPSPLLPLEIPMNLSSLQSVSL
jgi:hypothetical protein